MPAKDDDATVSFPATETFARLGRITASGLALRLGVDVARLEKLRTAVDISIDALLGAGTITFHAHWHDDFIEISISNPDRTADNADGRLTVQLSELVDHAIVAPTEVTLILQ